MRKLLPILVGLVLSVLTATALMAAIPDPHQSARIFDVCKEGCPFRRIQDALVPAEAAGMAESPSVVRIAPGTYRENLLIGTDDFSNPAVATTGPAYVALVGFSRDSVILIGEDTTTPVIHTEGGSIELRSMTVISNNPEGQAFRSGIAVNSQPKTVRLTDMEFRCPAVTIAFGCVYWQATAVAGFPAPRFEVRDSVVRFNSGVGLRLTDDGYRVTINTRVETIEGLVNTGAITGIEYTTTGCNENCGWSSFGDTVLLSRTNNSGTADMIGVDLDFTGTGTQALINNLFASVEDDGTVAAGNVRGVAYTGGTLTVRCYQCDADVRRPNSTGTTEGIFVEPGSGTLLLSGGRVRASNSDASAVDLVRSNGTLQTAFVDYGNGSGIITQTHQGSLTLTGGVLVADGIISFGNVSLLELTAASPSPILTFHNGDGSSRQLFATLGANPVLELLDAAGGLEFSWDNLAVFFSQFLVAAPATCVIGDWYVDSSGAYCGCTAINTWTNMSGVGTCV